MTVQTLLLILVSVSFSAIAQVLFKYGVSNSSDGKIFAVLPAFLFSPGVIGGLSLYGLGTILWLHVLSKIEVSQAYPFVGLGFILTAIMGVAFFGEHVGVLRAAGIVFVIFGIALIAKN